MPAIITNKFRVHNSQKFYNSFSGGSPNVYYLGIGKSLPFSTYTRGDGRTTNEGTDTSPVLPSDSMIEEFYSWDSLLAVKNISSSNISYVIPRINWSSGTIYDYYRPDYGNYASGTTTAIIASSGATNLFDSNFYVMNSAFNVYKCLDNNGNSFSTVQPTGTSTSILTTADGYKWKYMYTLSAAQQINFLSTDFMAVETNGTVSSAAVDGAVHIVKIKTSGTGGTNGVYTSIPIRGDGASGTVTVTISSNSVSTVSVTNVGSGYTYGYIRLDDINTAGGGSLTGSEFDVMIEPKGGHGFDAVKELGGFFVMLNVNLQGSELANSGDFTTNNDFRRVVIIKDPTSNSSPASATTLRATYAVRFAASPTPGTFQIDEQIIQSSTNATGVVVDWDSTNRILYYSQTRFSGKGIDASANKVAFSGTNIISGLSSGATGTPGTTTGTVNNVSLTSGYSAPEIDPKSGDVIYIENRSPISRAADQTENIKLIVEF